MQIHLTTMNVGTRAMRQCSVAGYTIMVGFIKLHQPQFVNASHKVPVLTISYRNVIARISTFQKREQTKIFSRNTPLACIRYPLTPLPYRHTVRTSRIHMAPAEKGNADETDSTGTRKPRREFKPVFNVVGG